jgi:riboflavin kinase / FMN adenylyltransferase
METVNGLAQVPAAAHHSVAAMGNFDGFHIGHQTVVGRAAALAERLAAPLTVISFDPHPARFFKPDMPPFALTTPDQKQQLFADFGVDFSIILPFTKDFAEVSAEAFLTDSLETSLGLRGVVTGFDFTFGKSRAGNTHLLRQFGSTQGIAVETVAPVTTRETQVSISSTLVREKLTDGQPRGAAALMGHWWRIAGEVMHGDKRGRTIGFPTANIGLGPYVRPLFGVYAVRVHGAADSVLEGVANLGNRPTVDGTDVRLEVHVFDFDGDLYGQTLEIELVEFIRAEMKFSGLDALKAQIAVDSATAQKILRQPAYAASRFKPLTRSHFESVMAK